MTEPSPYERPAEGASSLPPGDAQGTVTCPQGHVVLSDHVRLNQLGQRICPMCEQLGQWAPSRVRSWSRSSLRTPLVILAIAFAIGVIADVFFVASDASIASASYPGSTADLIGRIFGLVSDAIVVIAVLVIALLVARPDPEHHDREGPAPAP